MEKPVFIIAAGGRTGSTLTQRLITATGEVLVWGEEFSMLHRIREFVDKDPEFNMEPRDYYHNEFLKLEDKQSLNSRIMGGLRPPIRNKKELVKSIYEGWLGKEAEKLGYKRYGFKELRYRVDDANYLRNCIPDCKIIYLVRDVIDVLNSLTGSIVERPDSRWDFHYHDFFLYWKDLCDEFHADPNPKFLLRYEDLINPETKEQTVKQLLNFIEVDESKYINTTKTLDSVVFSTKDKGHLTLDDLEKIKHVTNSTREKLGYSTERLDLLIKDKIRKMKVFL